MLLLKQKPLTYQLAGVHVDSNILIREIQKEVDQENNATSKEINNLKKNVAKLEQRKKVAEDKWLDGEITKEQYHELLERISGELSDSKQKLTNILKEQDRNKSTLPDIAKLTSFDKLDRELLLMLVKRIDVNEDGNVKITYNF